MKSLFTVIKDDHYSGILTVLDYESTFDSYFTEDFPGTILVDTAIKTGISEYRFLEIKNNKVGYIIPKDTLVDKANSILRKYPDYVRSSALNRNQISRILN